MRLLFIFLLPLFLLSGCSDFYHLHYKKLKKVPANGWVAKVDGKQIGPANEDNNLVETVQETTTENSESEVKINDSTNVISEKRIVTSAKKFFLEKNRKISISKINTAVHKRNMKFKNDHSRMRIVFFLLVGSFILAIGIQLLIFGIWTLNWIMILISLAICLLGIIPFARLVISMVNKGIAHETKNSFKEK